MKRIGDMIINVKRILQLPRRKDGGLAYELVDGVVDSVRALDFEVKVLKFVRDKMLEYRDEAGEAYKALASAVARIVPGDRMRAVMATVAKGINYVLWNAHSDGERNRHATDGDMRHLAATIDDGFLRSEEELLGHLRRQWWRKWDAARGPKIVVR